MNPSKKDELRRRLRNKIKTKSQIRAGHTDDVICDQLQNIFPNDIKSHISDDILSKLKGIRSEQHAQKVMKDILRNIQSEKPNDPPTKTSKRNARRRKKNRLQLPLPAQSHMYPSSSS